MTQPMIIMVAGPYRAGSNDPAARAANLDALNRAALKIWELGHVPVIGVNLVLPIIDVAGTDRYDEIMMPVCLALAERCDAVLRVGGVSSGADREVALIECNGGTVYTAIEQIPACDRAQL